MTNIYDNLTARLRSSGEYLWPLVLRLIMFWEFWEAGITKFNGSNWFSNIEENFPFPFNTLGADLNWMAATYGEIVFSIMILLGLFTRFAAISLIVITVVATAAVHWPADWASLAELWKGYAISDKGFGNYKLPLLFIVILLPLVFHGGGKLSLDYLVLKISGRDGYTNDRMGDAIAAALAFAVLAVITIFLVPTWGLAFAALTIICFIMPLFVS
jgi:putative oxidoreductase